MPCIWLGNGFFRLSTELDFYAAVGMILHMRHRHRIPVVVDVAWSAIPYNVANSVHLGMCSKNLQMHGSKVWLVFQNWTWCAFL
jgi:hypothetical protein